MPRKSAPRPEALLSADDIKDLIENVAEIRTSLKDIKSMTEENNRTLRGHNGTEGYITKIERMEDRLETVNKSLDSVKAMAAQVTELTKYPTLTYLVRHRFKEVVSITIFMVSATILIGAPVLEPNISARLTSIVLRFVGALFGL